MSHKRMHKVLFDKNKDHFQKVKFNNKYLPNTNDHAKQNKNDWTDYEVACGETHKLDIQDSAEFDVHN